MKILTVVGARPQFIKAAVVSKVLRTRVQEILVHTGQHFDYNMSEQFFEELDIPKPDYNLGIAGGTHAQMTARMLVALEEVMVKEKPNMVLVYGDTNSTLAAALVAAKLLIPICHVEAGTRSVEVGTNRYTLTNPEEVNRTCTDQVSSLLLASTQLNMENLRKENLESRSVYVGDPMYDAFLNYREKAEMQKNTLKTLQGKIVKLPEKFFYMTCHREENTNDDSVLLNILKVGEQLDELLVYPVHPRNKERSLRLVEKYNLKNLLLVEPVGYLTSNYMVNHAEKIITDSGGLQREAFFAGVQCITVLDLVSWPETMVDNRNILSRPITAELLEKLNIEQEVNSEYMPFGDGHAAEKIVNEITRFLEEK